jgi:hypothetical protein
VVWGLELGAKGSLNGSMSLEVRWDYPRCGSGEGRYDNKLQDE